MPILCIIKLYQDYLTQENIRALGCDLLLHHGPIAIAKRISCAVV
jgi:hypothetical protein